MLRTLMLAGFAAVAFAAVPMLIGESGWQAETAAGTAERAPQAVALRPAAQQAPAPSGRKARIPADVTGHFSADFRLNGRTVPAMVDTGASVVALNRTTARRIGIDVSDADFTGFATTANGRTRAAPAVIARIAVGRIELRDVPAIVLDDKALSDTLVGLSFLSRLKRYSVEGGALALEQ